MRLIFIACISLVILFLGCNRVQNQEADLQFAKIDKVKVDKSGTVFLNGKNVTVEELRKEFAKLKKANGAVMYYRENPQGEPPAQALEVMQAIIDAKLPVQLVEKDFD